MIDRTVAVMIRRTSIDDATLVAVRELEQTGTLHTINGDREVRIGPVCTEVGRHVSGDDCLTGTALYQRTLLSLRRLVARGDVRCITGAGPGGASRWISTTPAVDLSAYEFDETP